MLFSDDFLDWLECSPYAKKQLCANRRRIKNSSDPTAVMQLTSRLISSYLQCHPTLSTPFITQTQPPVQEQILAKPPAQQVQQQTVQLTQSPTQNINIINNNNNGRRRVRIVNTNMPHPPHQRLDKTWMRQFIERNMRARQPQQQRLRLNLRKQTRTTVRPPPSKRTIILPKNPNIEQFEKQRAANIALAQKQINNAQQLQQTVAQTLNNDANTAKIQKLTQEIANKQQQQQQQQKPPSPPFRFGGGSITTTIINQQQQQQRAPTPTPIVEPHVFEPPPIQLNIPIISSPQKSPPARQQTKSPPRQKTPPQQAPPLSPPRWVPVPAAQPLPPPTPSSQVRHSPRRQQDESSSRPQTSSTIYASSAVNYREENVPPASTALIVRKVLMLSQTDPQETYATTALQAFLNCGYACFGLLKCDKGEKHIKALQKMAIDFDEPPDLPQSTLELRGLLDPSFVDTTRTFTSINFLEKLLLKTKCIQKFFLFSKKEGRRKVPSMIFNGSANKDNDIDTCSLGPEQKYFVYVPHPSTDRRVSDMRLDKTYQLMMIEEEGVYWYPLAFVCREGSNMSNVYVAWLRTIDNLWYSTITADERSTKVTLFQKPRASDTSLIHFVIYERRDDVDSSSSSGGSDTTLQTPH